MRLLYVSHCLPPEGKPLDNIGGMQRVAVDLHDSLESNQDIEVRHLVLRSPWSQRGLRTPLFLARALREIRRMARAREIDAILFSSMLTATVVVPLRALLKRNRIRTAAIVNGLDATTPTWPYPALVRRTFQALDIVLPISRATGEACKARGMSDDQFEVVSLGIRNDRFQRTIDHATARRELEGNREAKLIICSVGRLVPRKGVEWFITSVMPLLPEDVLYLVAGDGPDRERISSAISQYGLGDSVKLLGGVSDETLETLYKGADLFVMPNIPVPHDMEGFGLVLVEAGLCGLPAIASNIEGISDVISDGYNGHLVESRNAESFRDAIMQYYSDPEALEALRQRAREYTTEQFGWDNVVNRYISIIRSLN